MKRVFLLLTVMIVTCFAINAKAQVDENFDLFFQKFSADPAFQKARTKFPLKVVNVEIEGDEIKYITEKAWKFTDFIRLKKDKKNIIRTMHPANNMAIVQYGVEDTGILIQHVFKRVEGQWLFVQLKDMSD